MRLVVAVDLAQGGELILGDLFYSGKGDFFDYIYGVYVQLFLAGVSFVETLILLAVSIFYKIILVC